MQLKKYKSFWGMEGTYEQNFARAAEAGYDGIECRMPPIEQESAFRELLMRYRFSYIAMIFTAGDHAASFAEQVARAATFHPQSITSHSARDCMSEEEQDRFFEHALEVERRHGVPVGHETHRQRAMFTPWTTARLLRRFPELKITADFSHWTNVCESLLEDQDDALAIAIDRTIHLHGRIGYAQGPQVPHPGAPEYAAELNTFTGWWQRIYERSRDLGAGVFTFMAEFGPPGYMPTLPFTNQPVTDLWEVNDWMTKYFESRVQLWSNARARS